jgi:hypothetical protein
MPWRRWGIPDEIGWLVIVLGLAVGPVFLVAGFTVVEQAAVSEYGYWRNEIPNYRPGQAPSFPAPVSPPSGSTAVHFEIDVEGNGQVVLTPGGPCSSGSRCAYELPRGIEITLAAVPGANSSFIGWEGDCRVLGAQPSGTLVAQTRKRCLARFSQSGVPAAAGPTGPASAPGSASPTPSSTSTPAPPPTARSPVAPLPTPTSGTAGPREALRPQDCSLESTYRSTEGSVVTSIEFTNSSTRPVRIYWLNYSGQRQLYQTLPTTAHYVQSTWVTHPWVVTDLEGRCLALYMATSQPGSATLK